MLLGRNPASGFTSLLYVSPNRKCKQPECSDRTKKQRFIEFDRSLVDTYAIGIFEEVKFKGQIQADENDGDQD